MAARAPHSLADTRFVMQITILSGRAGRAAVYGFRASRFARTASSLDPCH